MHVELNHTIVPSRDKASSSAFIARILGLDPPRVVSHFMAVPLANGVTLDYDDVATVSSQHYAFLVDEKDFGAIFERVRLEGIAYFADPNHLRAGEINKRNGGRGLYFADPDGHNMEVFTKPPLS